MRQLIIEGCKNMREIGSIPGEIQKISLPKGLHAERRSQIPPDGQRTIHHAVEAGITPAQTLTEENKKVLNLLLEGRTEKEIGDETRYSEAAVKRYLRLIYRKMGVPNRFEAAKKLIEQPTEFENPYDGQTLHRRLTDQERLFLAAIRSGRYSDKEIARELSLSELAIKEIRQGVIRIAIGGEDNEINPLSEESVSIKLLVLSRAKFLEPTEETKQAGLKEFINEERQVMEMMAKGYTKSKIQKVLGVSSINPILKKIQSKLGISESLDHDLDLVML